MKRRSGKTLQSDDTDAKVLLAEVFYRRDDFQNAAASLKGVDVSSNKLIISQYPTLNVAKLESFEGRIPKQTKTGSIDRAEKKPERSKSLSDELKRSVENFDAWHPDLVAFVTHFLGRSLH